MKNSIVSNSFNNEKKGLKSIIITFRISVLIISTITLSFAQEDKTYLDPPQLIKDPSSSKEYLLENRTGSGVPSLAVNHNGRLWAVWYVGTTPETIIERCPYNYVVVTTSDDQGETWNEVLAIDSDRSGPVRAFDPEVWIDPDGQLWIFWAQQIRPVRSTSSGVWAITTTNPESGNPEWSEPRRLTDGVMMCKPIVLSDGEWALPVSYWHTMEESAKIVVSPDQGKTWQVRGAVNVPENVRNHDEHMIIERKDGSLWMLVRTRYGIGESLSFDKGFNWTPLIPSKIQHTASRFFIYRLNSGNLLLVKHGPIIMKTGRSHLMAFISDDEGLSWSNGLLLDERTGVTYPDGQETKDGTIYITYDYNRSKDQKILITRFTEKEILLGTDKQIVEVFNRRKIVSQGVIK